MRKGFQPVVIEDVYPEVDCGRYPVKREVGDRLVVWADVFKEGHDIIAAVLKYRAKGAEAWFEAPMRLHENDRWTGGFPLLENGRYEYTIEAWRDEFETWCRDLGKKVDAGQEVAVELAEGRGIVEGSAGRSGDGELEGALARFDASGYEGRIALLRSDEVRALMRRHPDRSVFAVYPKTLEVVADRERARYGAWYEMFPCSQGTVPGQSATFADCERRLPEIAGMGFDVVYLVPIHPIGKTNRKGRNNAVVAAPGDPGSPYGSEAGGHRAVHPDLGTLEDFRGFVEATRSHGMEVALDFATQLFPGPPAHRGASGVVQVQARRDHKVRREPAEEVPGHLQRQLRVGELARALAGAPRRGALLGRARREDLPGGQSSHQAVRVLGVVHRRDTGGTP